jgi:hypothetical protein
LYDDRVVVQARWFPNRWYEDIVELASLKAEVQEITVRYRLYRYAAWLTAIGALAYAACYYYGQAKQLAPVLKPARNQSNRAAGESLAQVSEM